MLPHGVGCKGATHLPCEQPLRGLSKLDVRIQGSFRGLRKRDNSLLVSLTAEHERPNTRDVLHITDLQTADFTDTQPCLREQSEDSL